MSRDIIRTVLHVPPDQEPDTRDPRVDEVVVDDDATESYLTHEPRGTIPDRLFEPPDAERVAALLEDIEAALSGFADLGAALEALIDLLVELSEVPDDR